MLLVFPLVRKKICSWFLSHLCFEAMGFLLKEALKTLCSQNQWCYAVFWKIGCQNSKLLIWEECYCESLPCQFPPQITGIGTSSFSFENEGPSRLGIQEGGRICSLIDKMMENNPVNVVGEGLIGRAAFTGSHQWILLNNLARDAYSPEVYNEVHHQFSAGMQTVAVIPVLPHGVVQLGSFIAKSENMGFVNDVKSLILQLACIPGALFSEDYSAKASTEKFGLPTNAGVPVSVNPLGANSNGFVQHNNSYHTAVPVVQSSSVRGVKNDHQNSTLTYQTPYLSQNTSRYHPILCLPKAIPIIEPGFTGPQNRVVGGEVMPSNFNLYMQQDGNFCNARSVFNELTGLGQSGLSDCSTKFMEQQILSGNGNQNHGNPGTNASSSLNMSHLKTNGDHILDQSRSSVGTSSFGAIPIHGSMGGLLRPNLIASSVSNTPKLASADFSGMQNAGIKFKNDNLTVAGNYSLSDLSSQSGPNQMPLEGYDQKNLPVQSKRAPDESAPTDQTVERINDDLLQTFKIPSFHPEEHVSTSSHIPGFTHGCLDTDAKEDEACAQPLSGDDLFDVLGVDFKNKLLNGNWNELFADELDANAENLDKKATCMSMHDMDPDCYSINETISESGIFSGNGTDHLLDAVVSKAQSFVKRSSDDMSCKTTLTRISSASVPSPAYRKVKSDNVQGGLFDFPKTEVKTVGAENSSVRPGCSKNDAGNCSQTTSIHGSPPGSWVESVSNVKLENSVSTGFSKRPDEVVKSNRKRLKPGENPRPRPKDRQMIQDRVKELREIVPNGAKCSIDALLERTIKHMLFLQSVTKHADKLKQTGESKIISKEGGVLLKDNFEGGATWAYEVGSQSMMCPIIVEDLNHPRQMLVEMLCEERGFFLEIADLIRGLGLTILKGVMEARNEKIWARFAVEANRDVTRMEIFMSLVRLLEQTVKVSTSTSNAFDNNMMGFHSFPQAAQIPATGRPTSLQ